MIKNGFKKNGISDNDMNRLNKNAEKSLDELIEFYSIPFPNQEIITTSQIWTVPEGVIKLRVSGCAAGASPNAGEYKLDQEIRVTPGDAINITVGSGNTIFGVFFELAKGICTENVPNLKLGFTTGLEGNPGVAIKDSFHKGGFGGAFGFGGGGGGFHSTSSSNGLSLGTNGGPGVGVGAGSGGSKATSHLNNGGNGGNATGTIITNSVVGSTNSKGVKSGDGGFGTISASGGGGGATAYYNYSWSSASGAGGSAGGYGAGGGTGPYNGNGEGSPGIIIIEY